GVAAAGDVGRGDQRHQLGVVRAALAEVAVEIDVHRDAYLRRHCSETRRRRAGLNYNTSPHFRAQTGDAPMLRLRALLGVLLVVVTAATLSAQSPPDSDLPKKGKRDKVTWGDLKGGPGGEPEAMRLLRDPAAKKALRLTAEQERTLGDALAKWQET